MSRPLELTLVGGTVIAAATTRIALINVLDTARAQNSNFGGDAAILALFGARGTLAFNVAACALFESRTGKGQGEETDEDESGSHGDWLFSVEN